MNPPLGLLFQAPQSRGKVVRRALHNALACLTLAAVTAQAAVTPLADQPLFSNAAVPGNLALVLSVEYPTAVSVAHSATYSSDNEYLGYFDPKKCYVYQYDAATPLNNYFYPAGAAASSHTCTGQWSGNFLNWATMQTIDPFRWALTGGYRVVDTPSLTVLERAWASGQGGTSNFPNRTVSSGGTVSASTPFSFSQLKLRVQGLGNKLRFTSTGDVTTGSGIAAYVPGSSMDEATVYELYVRVKVCDPSASAGGLEPNCVAYASGNYKPEGLIQKYSDRIRYSTFGYLNDSNLQRDGGVLRARQKFVGPMKPVPGAPNVSNSLREWDPTTGVFALNPDSADAADTQTLFGITVNNSGVMNYLNKFGEVTPGSYKTYDPVGELYYAAIRYFKHLGNVPEYTSMSGASTATKTTWVDGFPVITSWDDPILYSCQRNFVLGIGDVNTHADKNVPGSSQTAHEPAMPAAVTADTTVDALAMTNKVGVLEGLGASLGTVNPYNGCCNNNSALMAGVAYDAHTRDIRPDLPNINGTPQTVDTYWLDVLEYSTYKNTNQYYLAAKYGGFKVPAGYDSLTNTTPLTLASWSTNGEMIGSPTQARPDNYYVASRPDTMVAGLTSAFANIAASLKAYTTSFSTSLPQVSSSGAGSYAAKYDSGTWTGDVSASELSFPTVGADPVITAKWNFSDVLNTQAASAGWDTNRRIVTWNTATSSAVAFRYAQLSTPQQSALNTPYRGSDASDYLNYLRGDHHNEQASTDTGSAHAYRTRAALVGDIVGSKARPVAPPSLPFSDATNPGYAAFKTAWSGRPTMVYVGANDGLMHAINGTLSGTGAGAEVFAYVPGALYQGPNGTPGVDGLAALGNPSFVHHNYVNASPDVYDIDFGRTSGGSGTDWRSVLIGSLGKGGKSYYAIDVTDPATITSESIAASRVLWEFSDPNMGYTYGDPVVVKTKQYGWVTIFTSGYDNADGQGWFFIVNPRTGALLQKVSTGVGSGSNPAGMAFANGYVLDRTDGVADAVYAGDLFGNVWRLDLTAASGSYPVPTRISTLTDGSGGVQSVTTRPLIEIDPATNRRFVLVGTGRLLDTTDIASSQTQSYYAIVDGNTTRFNASGDLPSGVSFPIQRANLVNNTDPLAGATVVAPQMGWYIDLDAGWRVIADSSTLNGKIAFAATLPNGDACSPAGSSRIYALDFGTAKSILLNDTGTPIVYSSAAVGVVTDVKFMSVDGTPNLLAGTDQGGPPHNLKIQPWGSGSFKRLNWREVPVVN